MDCRQETYLAAIYGRVEGKVGMLCVPPDGSKPWQKMYDAQDIPLENFYGENQFLSLNTFGAYRRISCLKSLNAFYIDLDTYHVGKDVDDVLRQLGKSEYGKSIPYPTLEIKSGHGAYLIWRIQPMPPKELELWNRIQKQIHMVLAPYGSDPKTLDAARVLRVPGSLNAKNGCNLPVKIESWISAEYCASDFVTWFSLDAQTNETKKEAKKGKKAASPASSQKTSNKKWRHRYYRPVNRRVAAARADDIRTILLGKGAKAMGHREVALFLYRHFLMQAGADTKDALQQTVALNKELVNPLPTREVREATKTTKNCVYCPSNEWIIQQLDIPLHVQATLKTILSKEARAIKRRQKKGQTMSRAQATAQKRARIAELRAQGLNVTETCRKLGISRSTYYNLMHGRKTKKASDKTKRSTDRKTLHKKAPIIVFTQMDKGKRENNDIFLMRSLHEKSAPYNVWLRGGYPVWKTGPPGAGISVNLWSDYYKKKREALVDQALASDCAYELSAPFVEAKDHNNLFRTIAG